ncbi:MAG TPA: GIY-YIG nuclease family protein [Pyrinomonadaceae bacterium]|nr:GIY-YIG nuclease family protein [Pyrinomonadaceae bacterium]
MICERCKHEIARIPVVDDANAFVRGLDLDALQSLPVERHAELPRVAAVYFAIHCETVCYVGMTIDLDRRWQHHPQLDRLKLYGGRIAWIEIRREQLRVVEKAAILYFKPKWNAERVPQRGVWRQVAENLNRRSLPHEIRFLTLEEIVFGNTTGPPVIAERQATSHAG